MKIHRILLLTVIALVAHFASAQAATSPELESVLRKMDATATSFRSAQANFEWDRYEKVINEVDDIQFGTIYYRRVGDGIEMKANVNKPDAKTVLFSKGKIQVYQPKADQVIEHDAGKNRDEVESYFVLGFGGSGQEMQKSFDVTYEGSETVNGIQTAKLHLVPKSAKVRNNISEITLWIDPQRGISVQQKFVEPQGDYRLAKYSDIKMNEKINPDTFQIKTTGKTQVISK
ncbi:MAG TPA: outer membrane lipoprotein carrier protein LolA [Candidatus Sulfotelmatobacter sp.]|nr:outer membrane lipoprotein carrier protein LolA [Candidatus Sulfotelmatobacter sp.]